MSNVPLVMPAVIQDDCLQCPECEGENLHHFETRVVERFSEDNAGTIATFIEHNVTLRTLEAKDIPGRRDCIEIDFYCENCTDFPEIDGDQPGRTFTLRILQHKGETRINWAQDAVRRLR
jgi:hypothetical protein